MYRQKKYITWLAISLIGFVLFFPIHFSDDDCCLGDMWTIFGKTFHHTHARIHDGAQYTSVHHDSGDLVHRYVFPFGMLWWSSLALGYLSIRRLTNKNEKGQNEDFAQHSPLA